MYLNCPLFRMTLFTQLGLVDRVRASQARGRGGLKNFACKGGQYEPLSKIFIPPKDSLFASLQKVFGYWMSLMF